MHLTVKVVINTFIHEIPLNLVVLEMTIACCTHPVLIIVVLFINQSFQAHSLALEFSRGVIFEFS